MATIKKACKGVSYPKSSSVSGRLGSPSKAKTGSLVPSSSSVSRRLNIVKKAAKGTSLGMKSVKAGFDKNPGVTRADFVAMAKGKKGMKVKKAQNGLDSIQMQKQEMAKGKTKAIAKPTPISSGMMSKIKKNKMGGKTKKCMTGCK